MRSESTSTIHNDVRQRHHSIIFPYSEFFATSTLGPLSLANHEQAFRSLTKTSSRQIPLCIFLHYVSGNRPMNIQTLWSYFRIGVSSNTEILI